MKEKKSMKSNIDSLIVSFMKFNKAILFLVVFCASVSVVRATTVDVTTFFAVGDNSTDNQVFIQNAINSLSSTGGTVYFPPGLYNVHGTIYVPSNIRLQGTGSTVYNTQIRLNPTQTSLFEIENGASNIVFKDLTLVANSRPHVWPRSTVYETGLIRTEGTTGIYFEPGNRSISDVRIENVRITQFTYGLSAPATLGANNTSITNVNIRNYVSDGNEYSLYTNTTGATDWDVQQMNVYPMSHGQNGIFLERSGAMRFLQLSCAGYDAGICVKLWGNGDTYFRQMHVEGPRLGICVGSNCDGSSGNMGENSSKITIESSATDGEFHRFTNLVAINNRFWLDFPQPPSPPPASFKFFGTGVNSSLRSCGNVWVSWPPSTHMSNTTVAVPSFAFPGLATTATNNVCLNSDLTSVPVFDTGYEPDIGFLNGDVDVTSWLYGAVPNDGLDDTSAFLAAIAAARATRGKRVFVPAGTYDISSELPLETGETVLGESGSVINLTQKNTSLFKILNGASVHGITVRNLVLTSDYTDGTFGINFENYSSTLIGSSSDFQIQNVDAHGFEAGIVVRPVNGVLSNPNPMFDTVSIKDGDFSGNKFAILTRSANASNWSLENIRVDVPNGEDGVRIDQGGLSIRNLSCTGSGAGASCLTIQRHGHVALDNLTAGGVLNALVVRWETGWTQFPVTFRNSDLRAGVYFQGRTYLNSVNNTYPAKLSQNSTARDVRFGAYGEGDPWNVAYGGQSNVYSCNDIFRDIPPLLSQTTWAYVGTLNTPVTYCY